VDSAGNLYGVLPHSGANDCGPSYCGAIFQLSPSNGGWKENTIFSFDGANGYIPQGGLLLGKNRALYGTTFEGGGADNGTVFALSHSGACGRRVSCFSLAAARMEAAPTEA